MTRAQNRAILMGGYVMRLASNDLFGIPLPMIKSVFKPADSQLSLAFATLH
jgi:hypothetical protein